MATKKPSHALVTGAPGFLGAAIVDQLRRYGVQVRALAAPGENASHIVGESVEIMHGDIRDVETARRAVKGVDTVFHCAAVYKDGLADPSALYDVNINGTFHMLEAARRARVKRVIYTASVVSLGRAEPNTLADEESPYDGWDVDFPYSRSKLHARQVAEDFAAWGLDVRIVCPSVIFGPGDRVPTPSGQLVLRVARGDVPGYIDGGAAYVDVRDAAHVHWLAALNGRPGERYIASGHNLTGKRLLQLICEASGRPAPRVKIPVALARAGVRIEEAIARRKGQPPPMSREFFEFGLKPLYYDNRKSIEELGATYRDPGESVRDAIADFRTRGEL